MDRSIGEEKMIAITAIVIILLLGAFWAGGGPEKVAAVASIAWVLTGPIYMTFGGPQFDSIDHANAVFDLAYFGSLSAIAVYSNRLWPLAAAGLAFIPLAGHLAAALRIPGMTMAYWVMTETPFALILATICMAAWLARRRAKRDPSLRDWRPSRAHGSAG